MVFGRMRVGVSIYRNRIRVCARERRRIDQGKAINQIMDRERPISIASTAVTPSTCDFTVQLSRATSLIKRDIVQKLISRWRAVDVPVVMVNAAVRDGRAVIRIGVERVTRKISPRSPMRHRWLSDCGGRTVPSASH